jgi:hypothetical protein
VGIGTTAPSFENGKGLEIRYAGGNGAHLKLTDNASGAGGTNGFDLYAFNSNAYIENYEAGSLVFRNNGTEPMRITSDGNVGIGATPTSTNRLSVYQGTGGAGAYTGVFVNGRNPSSSPPYVMNLGFNYTPNNGTSEFLKCSDDHANTAAAKCIIYSTGNINNTNNSYGAISDVSLKENIVDATNKLDEVNQIQIRNFNFIGNNTKQIGVVAQELEAIFPSLVEEQNINGETKKGVKYSVLVPILVKAIQELSTKNDALDARITALEA